jgi:RNA polymerase sigma factor (sigma-70 family)
MPGASSQDVLRQLTTLFHCGAAGQLSDAELLDRFVAVRDELAFAALVERHGAMVLGVCRRVLGNLDGAEDAFQATFLVLARKAAVLARRDQLAGWLYGVAHRAALDARARTLRRKAKERRLTAMQPAKHPDPFDATELRAILDEELSRLPDRHRLPIVLCELEGLSRRDAAQRLAISEGTLSSRLARAKARLKDRLVRRGLALSASALAAALAEEAHAAILPPALIDSTSRAAATAAAGCPLTGVVSTSVATLTEGVLKTMLIAKLKSVAFVTAFAFVATGVAAIAQSSSGYSPQVDDRLKAVEQKLDRLLEVLGGKGRLLPGVAPAAVAQVPPQPTAPPAPIALPPLVAPAAAATPAAPELPATTPALPTMPPTPPSPVSAIMAGPPPAPPAGAGPVLYNAPAALLHRVESLERRFAELERRLGALERSSRQTGFRSGAATIDAGSVSVEAAIPAAGGAVPSPTAELPPAASVPEPAPAGAPPAPSEAPLLPADPASAPATGSETPPGRL